MNKPLRALLCSACTTFTLALALPATATAADMPSAATPISAPPAAKPAPPVVSAPAAAKPANTDALGRYTVNVSLSRIIAPMFQLKGDYALNEKMIAGVLLASGSPNRAALTSYSQHELGGHFGYYFLGSIRRGFGATGQVRGYLSSGEQDGSDGGDKFTAEGSAFSASAFVSARYQTKSQLVLQADAGVSRLWTSGTATGNGKSTEASGTVTGRLLNLWVGLVF